MPERDDLEPAVHTWFDADAEQAVGDAPDLDAMWASLDRELAQPGWRDRLVSVATPVRLVIALTGVLAIGALLVALQGLRSDLDSEGWLRFGLVGGVLMAIGGALALWPLRSRASAPSPLWPLIPGAWAVVLGFSVLAPWPGMTGVPSAMHLYCFGATSAAAVLATGWLALWDRSIGPVPQRIGLAAAGAGITAFVFQSLFCPGVDIAHLLIGHAAPTLGLSCVIIGLALVFQR